MFREIQAALDRGSTEVVAADSVEELAGKMGADPALLSATVDEYNDGMSGDSYPMRVSSVLSSASALNSGPDRREKCTQVRERIG